MTMNMKKCIAVLSIAMLLLNPVAMAEETQMRMRASGAIFVDESALNDEQLIAYQQAKVDYESIEDQQLANLVMVGTITQEEMDEYTTQRARPIQMPEGETAGERPQRIELTDEQREAITAAMQSEDPEAAMADLTAQGIIEEGQMFMRRQSPDGEGDGNMMRGGLWQRMQALGDTDTAAMIAVNNMGVASQMMRDALSAAGIDMPQRVRNFEGSEPTQEAE